MLDHIIVGLLFLGLTLFNAYRAFVNNGWLRSVQIAIAVLWALASAQRFSMAFS